MIASITQLERLKSDCDRAITRAASRMVRKISQFALDEIVLPPSGRYGNQRFNFERQPFARLWFELLDSGLFCRFAVVGPLQSGKTLNGVVIPVMYHLFEVGENVAVGIPQLEMAMDKWKQDFEPVIRASQYAELLPDTGTGSKGGKFESITFKTGRR